MSVTGCPTGGFSVQPRCCVDLECFECDLFTENVASLNAKGIGTNVGPQWIEAAGEWIITNTGTIFGVPNCTIDTSSNNARLIATEAAYTNCKINKKNWQLQATINQVSGVNNRMGRIFLGNGDVNGSLIVEAEYLNTGVPSRIRIRLIDATGGSEVVIAEHDLVNSFGSVTRTICLGLECRIDEGWIAVYCSGTSSLCNVRLNAVGLGWGPQIFAPLRILDTPPTEFTECGIGTGNPSGRQFFPFFLVRDPTKNVSEFGVPCAAIRICKDATLYGITPRIQVVMDGWADSEDCTLCNENNITAIHDTIYAFGSPTCSYANPSPGANDCHPQILNASVSLVDNKTVVTVPVSLRFNDSVVATFKKTFPEKINFLDEFIDAPVEIPFDSMFNPFAPGYVPCDPVPVTMTLQGIM